jgi:hypothetical protein
MSQDAAKEARRLLKELEGALKQPDAIAGVWLIRQVE